MIVLFLPFSLDMLVGLENVDSVGYSIGQIQLLVFYNSRYLEVCSEKYGNLIDLGPQRFLDTW